jgi:hypothetical protein
VEDNGYEGRAEPPDFGTRFLAMVGFNLHFNTLAKAEIVGCLGGEGDDENLV